MWSPLGQCGTSVMWVITVEPQLCESYGSLQWKLCYGDLMGPGLICSEPSVELRETIHYQLGKWFVLLCSPQNNPYLYTTSTYSVILPSFRYDPRRVVEQLRACGVLETVRISAAGYPSRWTYKDFYQRYHALLPRGYFRRGEEVAMVMAIVHNSIKVTYFLRRAG